MRQDGTGTQETRSAAADAGREVVVRVRGLVNRFGAQTVHSDPDLDLYRGEILGVVGGSGAGKSVLLRSIVGLQRFDAGRIEVFGQDIRALSPERQEALRRRWGVLFQHAALFSALTVGENVEMPLREFYRLPPELRCEFACLKLRMVGLDHTVYDKHPAELSGGMKKRAALARALAHEPELLFLDEPTSGLDPISAGAFDELIRSLKESLGLTVFLVTHDLDSLFAICDRVAVLAEGRVIAIGPITEVLASDHPWIRAYFHGPRGRAAAWGRRAKAPAPTHPEGGRT